MKKLETNRLILREWEDSDIPTFAEMNQDPEVMEFFPAMLDLKESEEMVARIRRHFDEHGFCFFAVELKSTKEFIGFVGLAVVAMDVPFAPAVEIGWRLASRHFGHGYATEAAKKVLEFAFNELQLDEVVSFTVPENKASRNVMEKIGMKRDEKGDFEHPKIDKTHRFCRHVLYRINKMEFAKKSDRS